MMLKSICEFLSGPSGEKSSKRLAGLSAAGVFLLLSTVGCFVFLKRGDAGSFIQTIEAVAMFAGASLGLGIFDNLFKRKYANNKTIDNDSIS